MVVGPWPFLLEHVALSVQCSERLARERTSAAVQPCRLGGALQLALEVAGFVHVHNVYAQLHLQPGLRRNLCFQHCSQAV